MAAAAPVTTVMRQLRRRTQTKVTASTDVQYSTSSSPTRRKAAAPPARTSGCSRANAYGRVPATPSSSTDEGKTSLSTGRKHRHPSPERGWILRYHDHAFVMPPSMVMLPSLDGDATVSQKEIVKVAKKADRNKTPSSSRRKAVAPPALSGWLL